MLPAAGPFVYVSVPISDIRLLPPRNGPGAGPAGGVPPPPRPAARPGTGRIWAWKPARAQAGGCAESRATISRSTAQLAMNTRVPGIKPQMCLILYLFVKNRLRLCDRGQGVVRILATTDSRGFSGCPMPAAGTVAVAVIVRCGRVLPGRRRAAGGNLPGQFRPEVLSRASRSRKPRSGRSG